MRSTSMKSRSLSLSPRSFALQFFIMTTAVLLSDVAGAQARFEVLHAFSGCHLDGCNPSTLVQGNDGNFYGMADAGKIYRLTRDGVFTVLQSFTPPWDGYRGGLIQATDGNFYGMNDGGSWRAG